MQSLLAPLGTLQSVSELVYLVLELNYLAHVRMTLCRVLRPLLAPLRCLPLCVCSEIRAISTRITSDQNCSNIVPEKMKVVVSRIAATLYLKK